MPSIRLIATDMDGTLLNSNHALSERTIRAVRSANQMGMRICLISARPPKAIYPYADHLDVPVIIAAFNGAYILSEDRSSLLKEEWLDFESYMKAVEVLKAYSNDINISAYSGERWFIDKLDDHVILEQRITSLSYEWVKRVERLTETDHIHKVLVMGESSHISQVEEMMLANFNSTFTVVRSKSNYLEISSPSISKGKALADLSDLFSISAAHIAAFGDNNNDADMLAYAGIGVAMGNATHKAKEAANAIALTNDEDGVAIFIENVFIDPFHGQK